MSKSMLIIALLSLLQIACGGARSPFEHSTDYSFASVSSNASITWQAPTEYTNQAPMSLSDIGGYHVYAGTSIHSMILVANISDSTTTAFNLSSLGKGKRFITVTCYNSSGIESGFSRILAVNII